MSDGYSNLVLAWPWLLLALPLPWLAARLLPAVRTGLEAALRIPFGDDVRALQTQADRAPGMRWPLLPLLAWALLCVAAARPQQLGPAVQPPETGRDLLLAVDGERSAQFSLVALQSGGAGRPADARIGSATVTIIDTPQGRLLSEHAYRGGRTWMIVGPASSSGIAAAVQRMLRRLPARDDWHCYRKVV